uniref:RING-type domain-containing protein n=1 Tax=Arcella intermedia TaxID=1963864 RepID=A0A6B2LS88_9EUKA
MKRLTILFEKDRIDSERIQDPICFEPVLNDIYVTGCGHIFHFDCLQTWVKYKKGVPTCPNCRQELREFATTVSTNQTGNITYEYGDSNENEKKAD